MNTIQIILAFIYCIGIGYTAHNINGNLPDREYWDWLDYVGIVIFATIWPIAWTLDYILNGRKM